MLIDGKKIAHVIQDEIAKKILKLCKTPPCLAVIAVGLHPASQIYIRRKIEACHSVGMLSKRIDLPNDASEQDLWKTIEALNVDASIHGILVQLPLPSHMNPFQAFERISPKKDVDGLHPLNMGRLFMGEKGGFVPCTPLGIRTLLQRSNIPLAGKHVIVMGRSVIVGKPTAALFLNASEDGNATVTVLHSKSENLPAISKQGDIVIVAIGKPQFLTRDMVKPGAVVIDVGINKVEDKNHPSGYRLVGDADFDNLIGHCSAITPVPGGVGPMTIAMLLSNTLQSYLEIAGKA